MVPTLVSRQGLPENSPHFSLFFSLISAFCLSTSATTQYLARFKGFLKEIGIQTISLGCSAGTSLELLVFKLSVGVTVRRTMDFTDGLEPMFFTATSTLPLLRSISRIPSV